MHAMGDQERHHSIVALLDRGDDGESDIAKQNGGEVQSQRGVYIMFEDGLRELDLARVNDVVEDGIHVLFVGGRTGSPRIDEALRDRASYVFIITQDGDVQGVELLGVVMVCGGSLGGVSPGLEQLVDHVEIGIEDGVGKGAKAEVPVAFVDIKNVGLIFVVLGHVTSGGSGRLLSRRLGRLVAAIVVFVFVVSIVLVTFILVVAICVVIHLDVVVRWGRAPIILRGQADALGSLRLLVLFHRLVIAVFVLLDQGGIRSTPLK